MIAAPAAGWYPDPILQAPLRWWDGAGWSERTMEEPQPAPQAFAPTLTGSAPGGTGMPSRRELYERFGLTAEPGLVDSEFPSTRATGRAGAWRPTRTSTAGAWGLAFLPWTSLMLVVLGAFAMGWVPAAPYVPTAIGLIVLMLTVALVLRDKRRLRDFGHERPASEWWLLLSLPAYLIARTVSVHRAAGKGAAPLVMYVLNSLLVPATVGAAVLLYPELIAALPIGSLAR